MNNTTIRKNISTANQLATVRTSLASERTLLAYFRTFIGTFSAGVGLIKLVNEQVFITIGYLFIFISPIILVCGLARAIIVKKGISRAFELENK